MNNRFTLTEEEKNRIRGLHTFSEEAGMDTPGGNPDFFYDEDSIMSQMRNKDKEISREEIIKILTQIHTLQHENAPAIAQRRLEELFDKLDIKINNKEI